MLDLHARYANTIDGGDADGWAACFTVDGALRTDRPLEVVGRAGLREFAASWTVSRAGATRHVTWHHLVDESKLVGRCSAALVGTRVNGTTIDYTAVYIDRYEQIGGDVLLSERVVTFDRAKTGSDE